MNILEGKECVRTKKEWVWLKDGGSKISDRFSMMRRMGCGQKGKLL